jgi:hypothetical protein
MVNPLPELEAGLFFDTPESSLGNISFGVDNRNSSWLDRMLELLVASRLRNLEPAVLLESANDFTAVHCGASFRFKNTHSVYTDQWLEAPEKDKLMVKHKIVFAHGEPKS